MVKECITCKKSKDTGLFSKHKKAKDGLQSACKLCTSEYHKSHKTPEVREELVAYNKEYRKANGAKIALSRKQRRAANPDAMLASERKWRAKNKNYSNNYHKARKETDLSYKLACNLRTRLRFALKNARRPESLVKAIGCPDLAAHIRTTYLPGMTDENYGNGPGQWSVDHIRPLSKFDLTDPDQYRQANHYTNLQAMWHLDNVRKGNRYES